MRGSMRRMMEQVISLFQSARHTQPADITLRDALRRIAEGRLEHPIRAIRDAIRRGRATYAQRLKCALPACTFQGRFSRRSNAGLLQASGIIVADVDHLPIPAAEKYTLADDPHVLFVFISPSGTGLKIGVRVPVISTDAQYKFIFANLRTHIAQHGLAIDEARKDISGLCFLSHDPDIYINPAAVALSVDWSDFNRQKKQEQTPTPRKQIAMRAAATAAFERWKQNELRRDLAWIESRLQNAQAGDPTNGRHAAYLAAGLRAGNLLGGYAAALISRDDLRQFVFSQRSDIRALDKRAYEEMTDEGMRRPKTEAALQERYHQWRDAHAPQNQPPHPATRS